MNLVFFEIYKRGLYHTLSKHVAHYGPWSDFMYYILTTLLSTIQGSAGQLCGLDPGNFYQYPVITLYRIYYIAKKKKFCRLEINRECWVVQ
jgi:hypothetical protein